MKLKKFLMVLMCVALFVASAISGFLVNSYLNFNKSKKGNTAILADNTTLNESVKTSAVDEIIVSPNAQIKITEKFGKCGHTITKQDIVPREIVNLNEEKIKKYYEGWSIDIFSKDKIEISRTSSGICNEHYILRESDGYISISCKNNIGEYIFKGRTDILTQYLPQEDLIRLEKGIEVVGREELNKILEDFE